MSENDSWLVASEQAMFWREELMFQNHFTDEESWGSVGLSQWPKFTELLSMDARIWTFASFQGTWFSYYFIFPRSSSMGKVITYFLPKAILVLIFRSFISILLIRASWLWWGLTLIAPVKAHIPGWWLSLHKALVYSPSGLALQSFPGFTWLRPILIYSPLPSSSTPQYPENQLNPHFKRDLNFEKENKLPNFLFLIKK